MVMEYYIKCIFRFFGEFYICIYILELKYGNGNEVINIFFYLKFCIKEFFYYLWGYFYECFDFWF